MIEVNGILGSSFVKRLGLRLPIEDKKGFE